MTTQITARRVLVMISLLLLAGCSAVPGDPVQDGARTCTDLYSESRCAAIDDRVASHPGIDPATVREVLIVPFDSTDEDGNLVTLGGAAALEVRVVLADGSSRDIVLGCGGIPDLSDPVCTDDPQLRAASVTMDGYRDVPCTGEGGTGCATLHPDIDPDVEVLSEPIVFARVDIPIDAVGRIEFPVGRGSLTNGILHEASFAFAGAWPSDVMFARGTILLDVRSLEPDGKPFHNYYDHGWREGLERIEAVLVFDVVRFEPGAILSIRDVLVR